MSCLVKTPWIKAVSVVALENYRLQVFLENAIGGICWPGGEDLAPDGLQRYVLKV